MPLTAWDFIHDEFPEISVFDDAWKYLMHAITEFEDNGNDYREYCLAPLTLRKGEWLDDYAKRFVQFLPGFNARNGYTIDLVDRLSKAPDLEEAFEDIDWDSFMDFLDNERKNG